jgi:glucose/arabinose dehydrogenase
MTNSFKLYKMKYYPKETLHFAKLIYTRLFLWSLISFGMFQIAEAQNNLTSKTSLPPVETQPAVAIGQKPAFAGQTRIGGVKTRSKIQLTTIASGLKFPWGLDFLPDRRMIVTEKPGNIRIVTKEGAIGPVIQGVPAVRYKGDGGLYDIKLDPDFKRTRLVFWTFVEPVTGGGVTSVARGKLSQDETRFEEVKIIYRASPVYEGPNHNGSRMIFDKKGNLFVSFGERFDDEIRKNAQYLSSSLGKIIRIDKEGKAVPGNPFEKTPNALPEIWTLGHRNPQGLAFNPETGDLWESEHGPQAGDEINIIKPGANYGWPLIAYGLEYSGKPVNGGLTVMKGMKQPVYYWDPAIAPSGITFYNGNLIPEWKGNLFVAALRGSHIIRLVIKDNKVVGEERLFTDLHKRFRYITQGPDGALYAIIDDENGKIFKISN